MPPQPPSTAPRVRLPRNWRGPYLAKKATAPPGFRYVRPGGKWQRQFKDDRGPRYVLARTRPPAPAAPRPAAPKPPAIPYGEYAAYPFFQRSLIDLDRQQQAAQSYVSDRVAPWLATALRGLTGVDPAQPGYNPTVQQQYLANVQGMVGGALNAAAGAVGPMPAATTPGAIVASPTAYESDAARTAAAQRSSAALQSAQAQSALNTLQPNTLAQGAVMALSDYAKGLPGLYSQRRVDLHNKIGQFLMEFEEDKRRARVGEALRAMEARGQLMIALGNLNLDSKQLEAELNAQPPGMPTNLPPGLVAVPNDQGGWDVREDPSYRPPGGGGGGTSTRDAQGRLRVPKLQEGGWTRLPDRYVKNGKPQVNREAFKVTRGADGNWWIIRKGGSGGSGGSGTVKGFGSLVTDLKKKWDGTSPKFGEGTPGWSTTFRGNPEGIRDALVGWLVENADSFNTKGGKFDADKARRVIGSLGDGAKKWALIMPVLAQRIRNGKLV